MSITNVLEAVPLVATAIAAVPLAYIDFKEHRLPNKLVFPVLAVTLVSWLSLAVMQGKWSEFFIALGCAIVVFAVGLASTIKGRVGMGDVKLFSTLVLLLAWFIGAWALLLPVVSLAAVTLYAVIKMLLRKGTLPFQVAVGPMTIVTAALMSLTFI